MPIKDANFMEYPHTFLMPIEVRSINDFTQI
jgi:hypothetical protein